MKRVNFLFVLLALILISEKSFAESPDAALSFDNDELSFDTEDSIAPSNLYDINEQDKAPSPYLPNPADLIKVPSLPSSTKIDLKFEDETVIVEQKRKTKLEIDAEVNKMLDEVFIDENLEGEEGEENEEEADLFSTTKSTKKDSNRLADESPAIVQNGDKSDTKSIKRRKLPKIGSKKKSRSVKNRYKKRKIVKRTSQKQLNKAAVTPNNKNTQKKPTNISKLPTTPILPMMGTSGAIIDNQNKIIPSTFSSMNDNKYVFVTASEGNNRALKTLLDQGIDIESRDSKGNTPLIVATMKNRIRTVKFLLSRGADINAVNKKGLSPIHIAIYKNKPSMVFELMERGANLSAQDANGHSPLHIAVHKGYLSLVHTILESGITIDFNDDKGNSLLMTALKRGYLDIATLLINEGAEINTVDDRGNNLLHIAAYNGLGDFARLLINKGLNSKIKNNNGILPEDLAISKGHFDLSRFITANTINIVNAKPESENIHEEEVEIVFINEQGELVLPADDDKVSWSKLLVTWTEADEQFDTLSIDEKLYWNDIRKELAIIFPSHFSAPTDEEQVILNQYLNRWNELDKFLEEDEEELAIEPVHLDEPEEANTPLADVSIQSLSIETNNKLQTLVTLIEKWKSEDNNFSELSLEEKKALNIKREDLLENLSEYSEEYTSLPDIIRDNLSSRMNKWEIFEDELKAKEAAKKAAEEYTEEKDTLSFDDEPTPATEINDNDGLTIPDFDDESFDSFDDNDFSNNMNDSKDISSEEIQPSRPVLSIPEAAIEIKTESEIDSNVDSPLSFDEDLSFDDIEDSNKKEAVEPVSIEPINSNAIPPDFKLENEIGNGDNSPTPFNDSPPAPKKIIPTPKTSPAKEVKSIAPPPILAPSPNRLKARPITPPPPPPPPLPSFGK